MAQTPTRDNNGESWTMGESLIQQYGVNEKWQRSLYSYFINFIANFVLATTIRRGELMLIGMIRCKGHAGDKFGRMWKLLTQLT